MSAKVERKGNKAKPIKKVLRQDKFTVSKRQGCLPLI
jgi:hypothetical protein